MNGTVVSVLSERPAGVDRIKVSVYASDALTAAGVGALLSGRSEFMLLPRNREPEADIVIVAADSVTADFVHILRSLASRTSARFVVILADRWAADLVSAAELGLAAVLPRADLNADRLGRALCTVGHGGADLPNDLQGRLLNQVATLQRDVLAPRGLNSHGLDNREVDVLRLLASGFGLREIGDKLSYSERTVKNILHALATRLGFRNRTQAVAYATRVGAI